MSLMKRRRVSKKTKSSWRKHVDITDVEEFLEDQRLEERLGKPISEKADHDLFVVDATPGNKIEISSKQKRRAQLRKLLPKCFSMLQSHTEVPDPVLKRNPIKQKEGHKGKIMKKKEKLRRLQNIHKTKRNNTSISSFNEDIWNKDNGNILQGNWIENTTIMHNLRGTSKFIKSVPKSMQVKQSTVHAIEYPHPGTSYNPSFTDHTDLLQTIAQNEQKIIKEEKHIQRVTRNMFKKITPSKREENWLIEMSAGLDKNELEDNEGDYTSINPPVQNKKKSLKQRRKQKEHQKIELARKAAKLEKKKFSDIYKLRKLNSEIEKREQTLGILRTKRLKKAEERSNKTKRLCNIKFQEPEIVCSMPQDIPGNLRNIKKEGDILIDRYKSLQQRNIIRPSTQHVHTRAKIKRFVKPGHKDDWKITIARTQNTL